MVRVVCSKFHNEKIAIQRAPDPRGRIDPFSRFSSLSVGVLFCIVDCNNPVCYSMKAQINVISVLGVPWPFVSSLARARGSFLSLAFFVMSFIVRRFVCDFPLPFYVSPTWIMRCVCLCVQFQQFEFIHSLGGSESKCEKRAPFFTVWCRQKTITSHSIDAAHSI